MKESRSFALFLCISVVVFLLAAGFLSQIQSAGGWTSLWETNVVRITPGNTADTTWMPTGTNVRDQLSIENVTQIGVQYAVLNPDTKQLDSLTVDLMTSIYPTRDSAVVLYPFSDEDDYPGEDQDTMTVGVWFLIPDSIASAKVVNWPQRYIWLRAIHHVADLIDAETLSVATDLWAAKGDSMIDWQSTAQDTEVVVPEDDVGGASGDSMYTWNPVSAGAREADTDEGIASIDTTEHIYVTGPDTVMVMALGDFAGSHTSHDSVKLKVSAKQCSSTVTPCTLGIGLAMGDTSLYFGDLVSDVQFFEIGSTRTVVEYVWKQWNSAYWTTARIDSALVVIDGAAVDTTANGDVGELQVYAVDLIPYTEGGFEAEVDEGMAAITTADYIELAWSDSFIVMAFDTTGDNFSDSNVVDSFAIMGCAGVSGTPANECILKVGLWSGDTTNHYFGMFDDTSDFQSVEVRDDSMQFYFSWAFTPSELPYDTLNADSLCVFLTGTVDTNTSGTNTPIRVYALDGIIFGNSFSPNVRTRATIQLKEDK